jgi:cellulose synthase (UDP-forming)
MPAVLHLADGTRIGCRTEDFSMRGLGVRLQGAAPVQRGDRLRVELHSDDLAYEFPFEVAIVRGVQVGLLLGSLTVAEEQNYVRCTFGSPEAWSDWDRNVSADHPLSSFAEVFSFGATGYVRLLQSAYNEAWAWLSRRHRTAAAG